MNYQLTGELIGTVVLIVLAAWLYVEWWISQWGKAPPPMTDEEKERVIWGDAWL